MSKARTARVTQTGRWLLAHVLIAVGAMTGAFGTVAWLAVLQVASLLVAGLGVLFLGVAPVVIGLAVLLTGIDLLDEHRASTAPERAPEDLLVGAAGSGATLHQIARRLGFSDLRALERRLDFLVARDRLELDVTDDGIVLYRAVGEASSLEPWA